MDEEKGVQLCTHGEREKKPVVCHWTKLNQSLRLLRRLTVTLPAAPKFIIKRLSALLAALFFFYKKVVRDSIVDNSLHE